MNGERIKQLEHMRLLVIDVWSLSQEVLEFNIAKCWANLYIVQKQLLEYTNELNQVELLELANEMHVKKEVECLTYYISELVKENQEAVYKVEYFSDLVAKAVLLIQTIQFCIVIEKL